MKSFLSGLAVGLLLACGAVGVVAWWTTAAKVRNAKRGWALEPVVVVSKNLAAGETITMEALSQRDLPSQFVTGSFVKPADVARVVGQKLSLPVNAGDPLTWPDFVDTSRSERINACITEVLPRFREAVQSARAQALAALSTGSTAREPAPAAIPPLTFDWAGRASVVLVTQEIREGKPIPASALKVGKIPRELVTAALVPADALANVVGAIAVVSMEPGDPVRWQFLDDPHTPGSARGCMAQTLAAQVEQGTQLARTRAETFFGMTAKGQ